MDTSALTTTLTTCAATPTTMPAATLPTLDQQCEHNDLPDPPKQPTTTNDFYLDTFFNPVWMSGPHTFSFRDNGSVVRPEKYTSEPYPGYRHNGQCILQPSRASHFLDFSGVDPKPWKNVAITEQDNEEFAKMRAEAFASAHAVGEWERMHMQMCYGPEPYKQHVANGYHEPELVYI